MKPFHILLVEDNEGDILLTTEALETVGFNHKLSVVKDGKAAVAFLTTNDNLEAANKPDLVLLDINLPKMNGQEVLEFIKGEEDLKQIPVIMLTTSSSDTDVLHAYKHHANCFITKPHEADTFLNVIQKIGEFWRTIVSMPAKKI